MIAANSFPVGFPVGFVWRMLSVPDSFGLLSFRTHPYLLRKNKNPGVAIIKPSEFLGCTPYNR
jgi:hypothetical protein